GIASRRHAEEIIQAERVTVNGHRMTELGSKADPDEDVIKVDGKIVRAPQRHIYILLNKPKNVMSTTSDPEGRTTVADYMQGKNQQIRRMFQSIGHPVEKLRRVRIGSLDDEKLRPGGWRFLTQEEVNQFKREFRK